MAEVRRSAEAGSKAGVDGVVEAVGERLKNTLRKETGQQEGAWGAGRETWKSIPMRSSSRR